MPAMTAARHTGRVVAAPGLVLVLTGCRDPDTPYATLTAGVATSGGSSSGWLVLVAILGGAAVITAALALFLTSRREHSRPVPLTPLPSETEPPPPLSSLNRPEQPLPRPLPPPEPPT